VSGQFRAGDTERFAATLADLHRLDVVRRGDTIELRRRK
jgi:ferric-dicitrate binding protein FerR (iron transport regulator)